MSKYSANVVPVLQTNASANVVPVVRTDSNADPEAVV
jgi:hypothetical protein